MILQSIIVILFMIVLASLSSGLVFLLKDSQTPKKRTLYALGIRISSATLLLATIFYGLYTGELGSHAPWDRIASKTVITPLAHP
ncbi:MAG: DUF2909 domain-containing protein [Cellvibrionaceae bacterium]|nr:DUF2909 domain-containing protein [Cellvibrionaceae bacterium]